MIYFCHARDKKPNIVLIDIEKISNYQHNAKVHPEAQIKKIAASIKKYGFDQPIVCDRNMVIIKGHGRFAASCTKSLWMPCLKLRYIPYRMPEGKIDNLARVSPLAEQGEGRGDDDPAIF